MRISFDAVSVNEAFARVAVAAFVAPLNPTMEEISDIKTAVSEAVTNAIIHGYDEEYSGKGEKKEQVYLHCKILDDVLEVEVQDQGKGIEDIDQAMEPLFTTKPEMDRSGMGFAFMEALYSEDVEIFENWIEGTVEIISGVPVVCVDGLIRMKKKLGTISWIKQED